MRKIIDTLVSGYVEPVLAESSRPRPGVTEGVVAEAVRELLATRFEVLLPRVMVVEFHAFRERLGLPADRSSTLATDAYLDAFGPEEVARWRRTYPVLADLLDRVASNSATYVGQVVDRLVADRGDLVDRGLLHADAVTTADPVVRLQPFDSDPHRGGTVVMGVELSSGARLVHKPRSMGGDEALRDCVHVLGEGLALDLDGVVPRSLDRGEYGWQEFVTGRRARGPQDAQAYYWRLGALAALLGAIGSADFHEENVLPAGDRPVLVDLETMIRADDRLGGRDVADGLGDRVRLSVAGTLLLPQRMPNGPYTVVLGGVGIPYEQRSSRAEFLLVDPGTDAVDIARRTYSFQRPAHVLTDAEGRPCSVLDHAAALRAGFAAGRSQVAARRDDILAALTARPFRQRQILRSTGAYARLVNALTHPDRLRSREEFDGFLDRLQPPLGLKPHVLPFVRRVERASFAEGDVPYFSIDSDDYRLRDGAERSPQVTDLTPLDRARSGLAAVTEDGLLFEELIIEDGLSELRRLRGPGPVEPPAAIAALLTADPDRPVDWRAVHHLLDRVAVRTPGHDAEQQGWVTGLHSDSLPTYDVGSAVAFHDAGGIPVFLRRACAEDARVVTPEELARVERGQRALLLRYRETLEQRPLSVFSGTASVTYAGLLRGTDLAPLAAEVARLPEGPGPDAHDLALGLPGAGLLLASDPQVPDSVVARALRGTAVAGRTDRAPYDLAHGPLGVLWARARMAARLGERATLSRATAAVTATARDLPADAPRAWCSGSAALTLVLAELLPEHGDESLLRRTAETAATVPDRPEPVDLSVCHGAAGVVQVLLQVARLTDGSWPLELARRHWAAATAAARRRGFVTGDPHKTSVLGYHHGWAGIGDTALLLERAEAGHRDWVPVGVAVPTYAGAGR